MMMAARRRVEETHVATAATCLSNLARLKAASVCQIRGGVESLDSLKTCNPLNREPAATKGTKPPGTYTFALDDNTRVVHICTVNL